MCDLRGFKKGVIFYRKEYPVPYGISIQEKNWNRLELRMSIWMLRVWVFLATHPVNSLHEFWDTKASISIREAFLGFSFWTSVYHTCVFLVGVKLIENGRGKLLAQLLLKIQFSLSEQKSDILNPYWREYSPEVQMRLT